MSHFPICMEQPMENEEKKESPPQKPSTVQKAAQKLSFLHYLAIGVLLVCLFLSAFNHH